MTATQAAQMSGLRAPASDAAFAHPGLGMPSPWCVRWLERTRTAPSPTLLDVASGSGRHARWAATQGYEVTALDRDPEALAQLSAAAPAVQTQVVDLESGPWPLEERRFDVVLCTNYLYRPRLDRLVQWLAPGGRLVYETFAQGNERFGRPFNPDYLLVAGELLDLARRHKLHVLAYEDGVVQTPRPARLQRLVALFRSQNEPCDDTILL